MSEEKVDAAPLTSMMQPQQPKNNCCKPRVYRNNNIEEGPASEGEICYYEWYQKNLPVIHLLPNCTDCTSKVAKAEEKKEKSSIKKAAFSCKKCAFQKPGWSHLKDEENGKPCLICIPCHYARHPEKLDYIGRKYPEHQVYNLASIFMGKWDGEIVPCKTPRVCFMFGQDCQMVTTGTKKFNRLANVSTFCHGQGW
jgi:hypothetical protein